MAHTARLWPLRSGKRTFNVVLFPLRSAADRQNRLNDFPWQSQGEGTSLEYQVPRRARFCCLEYLGFQQDSLVWIYWGASLMSSSTSLGLADCSQVDDLGVWYNSVNLRKVRQPE